MIKQDMILRWKKAGQEFYLGKPEYKTILPEGFKKRAPKVKNNHRTYRNSNSATSEQISHTKKYILYSADTDRNVTSITLEEVTALRKYGIKVYAEKDGFLC